MSISPTNIITIIIINNNRWASWAGIIFKWSKSKNQIRSNKKWNTI